jgi:predicted nucleotidyltransferase
MEYCRALSHRSSSIRPATIRRGGDYHDTAYKTGSADRTSASAIRLCFSEHTPAEGLPFIRPSIPACEYAWLTEAAGISWPIFADDFSDALFYRLLSETPESLSRYLDMSPDLAGRVFRTFPSCHRFSQLAETVKCKSYTRLHINRALLHCLLGITKADMAAAKQTDLIPYARVLGFRESATALLREITAHSSIPLITRMAETRRQPALSENPLFAADCFAADLYRMTAQRKFGSLLRNEYTRPLIRTP